MIHACYSQAFLDLLEVVELCQDTQSAHALKVLKHATQGFLILKDPLQVERKH